MVTRALHASAELLYPYGNADACNVVITFGAEGDSTLSELTSRHASFETRLPLFSRGVSLHAHMG